MAIYADTGSEACGTCFYFAPEILKESYNQKVDIFSLGIVLLVKALKCSFYAELFDNKELNDSKLKEELKDFVKDNTIDHQEQINNLLIKKFDEITFKDPQYVKECQKMISRNQAYTLEERIGTKFTQRDFIFMSVAMLQVIFRKFFNKINKKSLKNSAN